MGFLVLTSFLFQQEGENLIFNKELTAQAPERGQMMTRDSQQSLGFALSCLLSRGSFESTASAAELRQLARWTGDHYRESVSPVPANQIKVL